MKNIIITGGAGFIGSNFALYCLSKDLDKIYIIDKLTYAGNMNNVPKSPNINFIKDDLRNIPDIISCNDIDAIFNFAAESHVDNAIKASLEFSDNNFLAVHQLLEGLKDIECRFVQISTDEVYGSILNGSFKENSQFNPTNPYSASKAAAEHIVNAYHHTFDMDVIITRSSNNYGPHQHKEKLLPKMINNYLLGEPIGLYGNGQQIRDWTYVKDNCEGIWLASTKGKSGEVFNISAKDEITNLEMANKVAEMMNYIGNPVDFIDDRPGHDFRYSIDISKIMTLGWKPQTPIVEGLQKTIVYYRGLKR